MRRPRTFRNKVSDLILWLLFVAVSGVIWIGHALNSSRTATVEVAVRYVGVSDEIGVEKPLPQTILVRVRDIGQRIRAYYLSNPQITLDLSNQVKREHGEILITQDVVRHLLADQLPGTTRVMDVTPEEIRTNYYHERKKEVPIVADVQIHPAPQYTAIGPMALSQTHVTVYGNGRQLDTLRHIYTEATVIGNAKDSLTYRVPLECPKGLRLQHDTIQISQQFGQFTERQFDILIRGRNVPEGQHIIFFPAKVRASVQVLMSKYNQVGEEDIIVYCDYPRTPAKSLEVHSHSTNPGIIHLRTHPQEVEYIIKDIE